MAKPVDPHKRAEILKAAREVFKQNGYEKARVSEIAERAGVAKGTVYLYFHSKWDMLDALCAYYQEMIADAMQAPMKNPDARQALEDAVHGAFTIAARERDLLKLLDLRLGLMGGGTAIENPRVQKILRDFFRARMAAGELQSYDPVVASELAGGLIQWISKLCFLWRNVDVSRYERSAVQLLQSALLLKSGKEAEK